MSSLPGSFIFGSHSTAGFHEAFQSYRRSQYYFADTVSASQTDEDEYDESVIADEDQDVEARGAFAGLPAASSYDVHDTVRNLSWDEDLMAEQQAPVLTRPVPPTRSSRVVRPARIALPRRGTDMTIVPASALPRPHTLDTTEVTPLLHRSTSLTFAEPPRVLDHTLPAVAMPVEGPPAALPVAHRPSYSSIRTADRRGSNASRISKAAMLGKSTFGQTLFNSIAVLLGIGMLSEPLGFAYAGWIGGTLLMIFYGYLTCYTAKLLAHFILEDPKLKSYADIGRKAFGLRASPMISLLFCLELFTVSVALVTLFGDSLHSVLPLFSSNAYKLLGLIFIVPTVLMPLSVLSLASVIGILSTLLLVFVMFVDGLSKTDSPGSLWSPAPTSLNPGNLEQLGLAFGLFMAGFSGHAVIPSLAKDMVDPSQFDTMINWAFAIATVIYTTIGVVGYLMFGNSVCQEFSQDLMRTPGYNPFLNRAAMWGLVLVPISKFALATRPLNITIEMILGIDSGSQSPDDHGASVKSPALDGVSDKPKSRRSLHQTFTVIERTVVTLLSVLVSILVPEFDSVMAFLGSFSAFLICVIGPLLAKAWLIGRLGLWDVLLLLVAVSMAAWGTGAAFWSAA